MSAAHSRVRTIAVSTALLLLAGLANAANPSLERLALEVDTITSVHAHPPTSSDVLRRIIADLQPRLENSGYVVHRVRDAEKAIKSGNYAAAIRLQVGARPTYYFHSAVQYDELVETDHQTGARPWAKYKYYAVDGRYVDQLDGELGPIESKLHETVGLVGRPLLDDESAVSRTMVQMVLDATVAAPIVGH